MALDAVLISVKHKNIYQVDAKTTRAYHSPRIAPSATNQKIYDYGMAFAALQDYDLKEIRRVEATDLRDAV